MTNILLTKSSGAILGPISSLLGYLMNAIFVILDKIGIPNIGLSIIIFTLVIYLCMMPLTYKQQKFSKLSAKMNPELQAIQKKYKDKKDNESLMKMNEETQAVYQKYGVSATGSCLQLLIQMPILLALYRVVSNFPAYVTSVRNVFTEVVNSLMAMDGASDFLQSFQNASQFKKQFNSEMFVAGSDFMRDTFIDVLNKASTTEWMSLKDQFPSLSAQVQSTYDSLSHYNNFLGLNIANSPSYIMKEAIDNHAFFIAFCAILIPVLSYLTQFLNIKLMPKAENGNEQTDAMMASMKYMNVTMPVMSAVLCFTLPTGMGIYWIAGALIRCVQQIVINRHIDKIDFDEVIKQNMEKAEERRKKQKDYIDSATVNSSAKRSTRTIQSSTGMSEKEREEMVERARAASANKKGSIAAKVNMVREYNEKNNK